MWDALSTIAGVFVIGFAVREMFHDLFNPTTGGALSDWIASAVFAVLRKWPKWLSLAGPLAVVLILFAWALLFSGGFALVYLAVPASSYYLDPSTPPPTHNFWISLYFSLQAMTTLGLGDIKPAAVWLKELVALETLLGLALLTASVTWILLIYPALSRTRHLATTATILSESEEQTGVAVIDDSQSAERSLEQFVAAVIRLRVDYVHFPILYYFRANTETACIAHTIGHVERFAKQAGEPARPERLRLLSAALQKALDRYAEILAEQYGDIEPGDRVEVFRAYAKEHRRSLAA